MRLNDKSDDMRSFLSFIAVMLFVQTASGQKNPVDVIFDKYSGRDGITTVFISGKMLSMVSTVSQDNREFSDVVGNLTAIRILSVDEPDQTGKINLYSELSGSLNTSEYEELMVINEGKETVRFYIRESGSYIAELIMVTSGASSSLISIRGRIDLKTISALSKSLGIEELESLEQVNRKQVVKK